jgi:hypothetical protein
MNYAAALLSYDLRANVRQLKLYILPKRIIGPQISNFINKLKRAYDSIHANYL